MSDKMIFLGEKEFYKLFKTEEEGKEKGFLINKSIKIKQWGHTTRPMKKYYTGISNPLAKRKFANVKCLCHSAKKIKHCCGKSNFLQDTSLLHLYSAYGSLILEKITLEDYEIIVKAFNAGVAAKKEMEEGRVL